MEILLLEENQSLKEENGNEEVLLMNLINLSLQQELTDRDILNFRLSLPLFQFYLSKFFSSLNSTPSDDDPIMNSYFHFLKACCQDYDFSFQFGDCGGHTQIKKYLQNATDLRFQDDCYELISIITQSGCNYPMVKNILHKEQITRPLKYQFHHNHHHHNHNHQHESNSNQNDFTVLLRQIPASMHGEGQIAVGYIIWSAAIILSRWICLHSSYFRDKLVLEIGAGTGLCGIVACACGSSVIISDYTNIILSNILQNIRLNLRGSLVEGVDGCLESSSNVRVYHLDWDTLAKDNSTTQDSLENNCQQSNLFPSLPPTQPSSLHKINSNTNHQHYYYDIIIASDMVCCDSDAIGVCNTLLSFLHYDGIAFFAVPNPYHRYGIAKLIPTLQEYFHVFIRSISHSSFNSQRHPTYSHPSDSSNSSDPTNHLTESLRFQLNQERISLIESLLHTSSPTDDQLFNDFLTEGLPEKEYFEWFLLIVIKKVENTA